MLPDCPTLDESHTDAFPPVLSVNDHAELCAWLDATETMRAAYEIDSEMERLMAEEMQRREIRELPGEDVPCRQCGVAIFANGHDRLCPACRAELTAA